MGASICSLHGAWEIEGYDSSVTKMMILTCNFQCHSEPMDPLQMANASDENKIDTIGDRPKAGRKSCSFCVKSASSKRCTDVTLQAAWVCQWKKRRKSCNKNLGCFACFTSSKWSAVVISDVTGCPKIMQWRSNWQNCRFGIRLQVKKLK